MKYRLVDTNLITDIIVWAMTYVTQGADIEIAQPFKEVWVTVPDDLALNFLSQFSCGVELV